MAQPRSKSPFPGMDPYLEQYWGDVRHRLCTYSCDLIRRSLPAGLIARLDERTVIEDEQRPIRAIIPDVRVVDRGNTGSGGVAVLEDRQTEQPLLIDVAEEDVTEGFVQVIDARKGGKVITVIEFASPANKISPRGREMYRQKQRELIDGGVSLVEIDLIRSGQWNLRVPQNMVAHLHPGGAYHVCVTRGWRRFRHEVYPIDLPGKLPMIAIPLREDDPDAKLDLQALIDQVYENGSYGYDVDYTKSPVPPLGKI